MTTRSALEQAAEALKPFADAAAIKLCGQFGDDERVNKTDTGSHILFGHLRTATTALAAVQEALGAPADTSEDVVEGKVAAISDVIAERERQQTVEGWTPKHDDTHNRGELSRAAICYADPLNEMRASPPAKWPWDATWWKPKDRRADLVRAGALILAEIERLDRAAIAAMGE